MVDLKIINPNAIKIESLRHQVHDIILSILPGLGETGLDERLHLKELGADSIDRIEIIMSLLQHFKLRQPMSLFSEVPNVAELIALLKDLTEGGE